MGKKSPCQLGIRKTAPLETAIFFFFFHLKADEQHKYLLFVLFRPLFNFIFYSHTLKRGKKTSCFFTELYTDLGNQQKGEKIAMFSIFFPKKEYLALIFISDYTLHFPYFLLFFSEGKETDIKFTWKKKLEEEHGKCTINNQIFFLPSFLFLQ